MKPLRRADAFDVRCRDDGCAASVGIGEWLGAVMGPLKCHTSIRCELLEEMLDECTDGIDPSKLRVQPDAVRRGCRLGVEGPAFHFISDALRDVFRQIIVLSGVAHDLCELQGVLLCSFMGQRDYEAEGCEVVSHVI